MGDIPLKNGRRDIIAAALRQFRKGPRYKALFVLIWLPMPLSWSRARYEKVKKRKRS